MVLEKWGPDKYRSVLKRRRGGRVNLGIWQVYGSEHRELSWVASIFSMKWNERCLLSIDGFNMGVKGLSLARSFFAFLLMQVGRV